VNTGAGDNPDHIMRRILIQNHAGTADYLSILTNRMTVTLQ
jgi:hypothetical protein